MKLKSFYLLLLLATIFTWSCEKDADIFAPVISGAEVDTVLNIGDKLVLAPDITNLVGIGYTWLVNGEEVASEQTDYTFTATEPGNFVVTFRAANKGGAADRVFNILVEAPIAIALQDGLSVARCQVLDIEPAITGPDRNDYQYEWMLDDDLIGITRTLPFIALEAGDYTLTLIATAGKQSATASCSITVEDAEYLNHAYALVEYFPAPAKGFWWRPAGDNALAYNDLLDYFTATKKGSQNYPVAVGSWGGYATFKFDHTVVDVPGDVDLELRANCSVSDLPTVYVAYDHNKNGKPDDNEWYEIKNDDYGLEDLPDYEITFAYKDTDIESNPQGFSTSFTWKDNQEKPQQGEVANSSTWNAAFPLPGLVFSNGFFPGYYMKDKDSKEVVMADGWQPSFTRKGKRITRDISGKPTYSQRMNLDIAKAVNANGELVQLPGIDFVKIRKSVYTFEKEVDSNMNEDRMLIVRYIIDKHL